MTGRLRALADTPLGESARAPLFALSVAVLAIAAAALLAIGHPPAAKPHRQTAERAGAAPLAPQTGTVDVHAADRAARRFVAGYLRFVDGRERAGDVGPATGVLRRRLARTRARVIQAARRRRPRVVALETRAGLRRSVAATVWIADDKNARYPIDLTLRSARGRWVVVAMGTD